MPLPKQTQLRLLALRDVLTSAQAGPPPVPAMPPSPPLSAAVMKQLNDQHPDLAKLITGRIAALQQRAANVARAQEGLKRVYADALAHLATMLKGETSKPSPAVPRGDRPG